MARKKNSARNLARQKRLRPLAGLVAMGLTAPGFTAQPDPFPTYVTGPQSDGSYIVGNGQRITPAGVQVGLGIRVRAKAIALNPNPATHSAAVLTLGADQAVEVFDTRTGAILQDYSPFGDPQGSYSGIAYSADGKYLMFSQDSSNVAIASVAPNGKLSDHAHVSVPPNNSFIKCFPNSPIGDYGVPCGTFYTTSTSYPGGVAFSEDGKSAYALLNQNNTVTKIDLTASTPVQGTQIRVGNAPHSIVVRGQTAYISNEGGREARQSDFQVLSSGAPIVADPVNGSSITGTVSVVDLKTMKVVDTIAEGIGLHPTGMALFGDALLVTNTYSDTISVIDTATNRVMRTIDLGLPVRVPGHHHSAYGAGPNSIAVDKKAGIAYVALYNANAIAVVDLSGAAREPVLGMIPVAYAPASVVIDTADNSLLVANDKGIGTRLSFETDFGVTGFNSHQDNGTVSIVPLPHRGQLEWMTRQVYHNNHWDLRGNIESAAGGDNHAHPVAIPANIGDPSLIKHVFLIIRENRTYDQVLGDVSVGNGDPTLAVFGGAATPNMHDIVKRFPLLDNFYTPSRQSADGHQWIVEAMAPYSDDIESPDWVRSYPGGNAGDALAYTKKGFLFQEAAAAGLGVKIYGEYVENENFPTSQGHPTWSQFYADSKKFEAGQEKTLTYQNAIEVESSVPVVSQHLVKNFPMFDLNIPDQFRVDLWVQDFNKDLKAGNVPALSILWIIDDHTGGPPAADAEQADNDLAVGRIIDYISHSSVWKSSAIFIEEDDSQNGVDHVDGHRSPGYIVSPYAVQRAPTDHTYYTQVNMTRTIEQILGLPPMNQFDLVASPMTTCFVDHKLDDNDPHFKPFNHLPAQIPLDKGVTPATASLSGMAKAWKKAKMQIFAGKSTRPDSEDPDTVNHLAWYEATNFKRPYPGETKVRPPTDFINLLASREDSDD